MEANRIYVRNQICKQSTRLDTVLASNYILYFGPPGKYLWTSRDNRLSLGRLRRPMNVGFWGLKYGYVPAGPKSKIRLDIVSNRLDCLQL